MLPREKLAIEQHFQQLHACLLSKMNEALLHLRNYQNGITFETEAEVRSRSPDEQPLQLLDLIQRGHEDLSQALQCTAGYTHLPAKPYGDRATLGIRNLPSAIAQAEDLMSKHQIDVPAYLAKFTSDQCLLLSSSLAINSQDGLLSVNTPDGSSLKLLTELGSGSYGFVLQVVDKNGDRSALKMVPVVSDERNPASGGSKQLRELQHVDHLFTSKFQTNSSMEKANDENCASTGISTETQFTSNPTETNDSKQIEQFVHAKKLACREVLFHIFNAANECPNIVRSIRQWYCPNLTKSDYFRCRNLMKTTLNAKVDAASKRIEDYAPEHSKITVFVLQMQFYPMGSLERWLQENHEKFSGTYNNRVRILRGTLAGLEYIHSHGLIHRDLNPQNVLLEDCNGKIVAKIADFGTAISCGATCDWQLTKTRDAHTHSLGTDPYIAPEVKTASYDNRCDLFSFGMIVVKTMWNVQELTQLFQTQIHLLAQETANFEKDSKSLPNAEAWLDLVKSLVTLKYATRPSCSILLQLKKVWEKRRIQHSRGTAVFYTALMVSTPAGRLQLMRQIGSGAFGFVFEVVDESGFHSALKMVPVISAKYEHISATSKQSHKLKHSNTSEFVDKSGDRSALKMVPVVSHEHNLVSSASNQSHELKYVEIETLADKFIDNKTDNWLYESTDSESNESDLDNAEQFDYEDKQARREALFHKLNAANQCPNIVHSIGQWCCADITKSDYCALRNEMREKLNIESLDVASSRIKHDAPKHSMITVNMLHMQFYPMGSLERWLKDNHGNFSDTYDVRVYILRGILVGLHYIHSQGVIHRGLCPPNVLLEECNGKVIAKIGDFGTVITFGARHVWKLTKTRDAHTRSLGTDPYCAPEVETGLYDERCDLFSFGMIAVKAMWNVNTYVELAGMRHWLLSDDTELLEKYSKSLLNAGDWLGLVNSLVTVSYKRRPSSKMLLQNKLFLKESGSYHCKASASCA